MKKLSKSQNQKKCEVLSIHTKGNDDEVNQKEICDSLDEKSSRFLGYITIFKRTGATAYKILGQYFASSNQMRLHSICGVGKT